MLVIMWLLGQVPGVSAQTPAAPNPVRWVSFQTAAEASTTTDIINIAWDAEATAVDYQIDYTDEVS